MNCPYCLKSQDFLFTVFVSGEGETKVCLECLVNWINGIEPTKKKKIECRVQCDECKDCPKKTDCHYDIDKKCGIVIV